MRIQFSLTRIARLALPLLVMVGSSRAQTSSPQLIELESGETTKVATGIATQGSIKVYLLQNNAAEKKNVRIRLTPADHARFGVYDKNDVMINEDAGSNVFDADLAEGEKIKLEIWAVRATRIQFTLVITLRQTNKSSGVEISKPAAADSATIPNPHRHTRGEDVLSTVAPGIRIVEANASDYYKDNWVENKAKTFGAFTTTTEEGIERILFEDLRANKTYEIQGVAWPNRPLNDPVCVGAYFIFDRSVNPQRSMHYAFDLNKRIIVAARAF
jgi:hypothetical protein